VSEGRVPGAVAVEIADGPFLRAQREVENAGLTWQIGVRRGDGLGPLTSGEVVSVVICGMGGGTILRILEDGQDKLAGVERLVLSPHTSAPSLRRQMVRWGWTDVDGCLVEDRGHFYPVTAWERGGSDWSEADYRWGRFVRSGPDPRLEDFLQAERARVAQAHSQAGAGRDTDDAAVSALLATLSEIDGELARLR
jgi:tRNA A22 N-methylase